MQADQHLTTLAGLADPSIELRDPARGFGWRHTHQLRQAAVVDGLAGEDGDETYPHLLSAETLSIALTSPFSCERSASRFASSSTGISVGERSA